SCSLLFAISLLCSTHFCRSIDSLNIFELSHQVEVVLSTELVYLHSTLPMLLPSGYSASSRLLTIIPSTPTHILFNDEMGGTCH
ncbi:MAG TPA: hypothetical protein VGO47_03690, partial [Chlamydiales bacterium]|nr:hypothetical protein [Chlamydiales bacterium]